MFFDVEVRLLDEGAGRWDELESKGTRVNDAENKKLNAETEKREETRVLWRV